MNNYNRDSYYFYFKIPNTYRDIDWFTIKNSFHINIKYFNVDCGRSYNKYVQY